MAVLVYLVLLLAMTGHSSATYCICKDGDQSALQKAIDYACGNGADCSAILQTGACYNPNTVKDHCNYAVNSYYQKKGQVTGSCDFSGAATTSTSLPTTVVSGCTYQSSPSSTTGTPTTPTTGTPTTGTPTTPSTTTPSTTTPTTTPSSSTNPSVFGTGTGLGPSGTAISSTDSSATVIPLQNINLFSSLALSLWFSGFLLVWGEYRL